MPYPCEKPHGSSFIARCSSGIGIGEAAYRHIRHDDRSRSAVPGWLRNMLIIVGTSTQTRDVVLLDHPADEVGIETRARDLGAGHERLGVHVGDAGRVEHRREVQEPVGLEQRVGPQHVLGVDHQVAVGLHHALGQPGRAAGVGDAGDAVGVEVGGRRDRIVSRQLVPGRRSVGCGAVVDPHQLAQARRSARGGGAPSPNARASANSTLAPESSTMNSSSASDSRKLRSLKIRLAVGIANHASKCRNELSASPAMRSPLAQPERPQATPQAGDAVGELGSR